MRNALKIAAAVFTVAAVSAAATETLANSPATIPFIPTGISQSASSVGFADSDVYGMNADDINHTFDLMSATGVRTVRIIIPWAGIEGTQGSFNWGQVDTVVGAANARHMSVVGAIVATPAWAVAPGAIPISSPPASVSIWPASTKSARLPVTSAPTTSATKTVDVIAKAIPKRVRLAEATSWSWPAPIGTSSQNIGVKDVGRPPGAAVR